MAEIHRRSNAQEQRLAQDVGGRRTPRSGAGVVKGDVRSNRFLYEAKTTKGKSYNLTDETLRKLRQQGFVQRRGPVLEVEMGGYLYAVVPMEMWIEETGGG